MEDRCLSKRVHFVIYVMTHCIDELKDYLGEGCRVFGYLLVQKVDLQCCDCYYRHFCVVINNDLFAALLCVFINNGLLTLLLLLL